MCNRSPKSTSPDYLNRLTELVFADRNAFSKDGVT